jgi:3-hydroxyacyl-CoA dehydrogenase
VHLADVADTARDVDFAMRWGFGMKQGPFELWQEAGWKQVASGSRKTSPRARRCRTRRCRWVFKARWPKPAACTRLQVRGARRRASSSRAACCRCKRQLFPEIVLGSEAGRRR